MSDSENKKQYIDKNSLAYKSKQQLKGIFWNLFLMILFLSAGHFGGPWFQEKVWYKFFPPQPIVLLQYVKQQAAMQTYDVPDPKATPEAQQQAAMSQQESLAGLQVTAKGIIERCSKPGGDVELTECMTHLKNLSGYINHETDLTAVASLRKPETKFTN